MIQLTLLSTAWCFVVYADLFTAELSVDKNMLQEAAYRLMSQAKWKDAIYFTDGDVHFDASQGMLHLDLSCTIDISPLNVTLNTWTPEDDFLNVLVSCSRSDFINILEKMANMDPSFDSRHNYLYIADRFDASNFTTERALLRNGDNFAVILDDTYILNKSHTDKTTNINSTRYEETNNDMMSSDMDSDQTVVYYCYYFCRKQSLLYMDNAENKFVVPSKFLGFQNDVLSVVSGEYRPFRYTVRVDNETTVQAGIEIEILEVLSKKHNFRYEMVPIVDGKWGSIDETGAWNGMIGMVMREEADIAVSGISISPGRESVIDFSYPFFRDPSAIVMKLHFNKWRYFIDPFHWTVWLIIIVSPLVVACMLNIFLWVLHGGITTERLTLKKGLEVIFGVYSNLVLQEGTYLGSVTSHVWPSNRVLIFSFWIGTSIIGAVYSASLTATLAVFKVHWPFNSLEEFARQDKYKLVIQEGSIRVSIFQDARAGVYKQIWDKMMENPEESMVLRSSEAEEKIKTGTYAFASDKTALYNMAQRQKDCSIVFMREVFYDTGYGLVMQQGSPYRQHVDNIIYRLGEIGLLEYWYRKNIRKQRCFDSETYSQQPVRLGDLTILVQYVLMLGLGMSVSVFIVELMLGCGMKCRKCCKERNRANDLEVTNQNEILQ